MFQRCLFCPLALPQGFPGRIINRPVHGPAGENLCSARREAATNRSRRRASRRRLRFQRRAPVAGRSCSLARSSLRRARPNDTSLISTRTAGQQHSDAAKRRANATRHDSARVGVMSRNAEHCCCCRRAWGTCRRNLTSAARLGASATFGARPCARACRCRPHSRGEITSLHLKGMRFLFKVVRGTYQAAPGYLGEKNHTRKAKH